MHILSGLGPVFPLLLATAVLSVDPAPSPTDPKDFAAVDFDFIVIGGGTSGLVVAERLTENPSVVVGVIEAGEYRPGDPLILIPGSSGPAVLGVNSQNSSNLQNNPLYDWRFQSTPQPNLDGTQIRYPRGKVIWERASGVEYDLWESAFKNPGWNFANMLPFFKKVENWTPPNFLNPGMVSSQALRNAHGTSGAVNVSYNTYRPATEVPCVEAGNALGLVSSSDPDSGNGTGLILQARNVNPVTGFRVYAGPAYFEPHVSRPNLKLVSSALVTKINFASGHGSLTAVSVDYVSNNVTYTAKASKEIILAAGTIQTPQVLELSGVGNKTLLSSLGIKTLLDVPLVGENLQDHPVTYSDFEVDDGILTLDDLLFNATFANDATQEFNKSATGPLSYTAGLVGPSTMQSLTASAAEFKTLMTTLSQYVETTKPKTPLHAAQIKASQDALNAGKIAWIELVMEPLGGIVSVPAVNTSYMTVVSILLHPFARGSVHIQSSDPTVAPLIDPNFMDNAFDIQALIRSSQFTQRMVALTNVTKGPNSPSASVQSDADFDTYIREHTGSTAHPLGTMAMAPQKMGGVVDSHLRVYGLQNVRVVDASIIPFTLSTAIMQTVFAVAEKAASIIQQDNHI
ncbi:hypothetical protein D9757_012803 [Collybiopsis confluens]|uniref:Glucose-methanol-choline oxidoreductase N-terminal domain-containing protein n=1 Tax=Collybiopsis confluens TaxID=2823264 RepID=A0A8H5LQL2_9AGAR|nr:hypothetical protein D9757_012803 [Collybiopsis confluens]